MGTKKFISREEVGFFVAENNQFTTILYTKIRIVLNLQIF